MDPFLGADAVGAGLLTYKQLRGPGYRRLLSGVYVGAGVPVDHRVRCVAAGLYLRGRGVVSGLSAAALWGADLTAADAPVEVTVPAEVRLKSAALSVVRSALPPGDVTRIAGTRVTTSVRTAFDLARRLPADEAVIAVDALLNRRMVTIPAVRALAERRPGWPGLVRLGEVLALADPGAESPMETRVRLLLVRGGLPRPVTQHEVYDRCGVFVGRLDLAYPDHHVGIEYEGAHHREAARFQRDLWRLDALRACGWTVLRFGPADVYGDPRRMLAVVREAGRVANRLRHRPEMALR